MAVEKKSHTNPQAQLLCYSYYSTIHKMNVHECSHEMLDVGEEKKIAYGQLLFPFKFPCVCDLKCKIMLLLMMMALLRFSIA